MALAALFALAIVAALAAAGCHSSHGGGGLKVDGGHRRKSCGDGGVRQTNGAACGCNADCASDFCVDGVCCNSACTETCKSCNTPSAPGVCSFIAAGVAPSVASVCPQSPASTCGLDGTCDGKEVAAAMSSAPSARPGTCNGAAVGGVRRLRRRRELHLRSVDHLRAVQLRQQDERLRRHLRL